MLANFPDKFSLAHLPTALEPLPRLEAALATQAPRQSAPRLFVKRDDQTGLATGGNKTRKLEYLLADALAAQADMLLTVGAPQSNHCRQTAAAAARAGLECLLVLGGNAPLLAGGNLLLDQLLGAEIVWAGQRERLEVLAEAVATARQTGRRPYAIPYGGSNPLGSAAYAAAFLELVDQAAGLGLSVDHAVVASSSGGTQAGLAVGALLAGFAGQIHGISIDRAAGPFATDLASLATATAHLLGLDAKFAASDFIVHDAYLGAGYGIVGDEEREALQLAARCDGLLLDPVYTARAMAGMIDLLRQGRFERGDTVVFWHTGGLPAIFAYGEALAS